MLLYYKFCVQNPCGRMPQSSRGGQTSHRAYPYLILFTNAVQR